MNLDELKQKARKWAEDRNYPIMAITDEFILYKKDWGNRAEPKFLTDFEEKEE